MVSTSFLPAIAFGGRTAVTVVRELGGRTCRRDALVRRFFGEYVPGPDRGPGALQIFNLLGPAKWTDPSADGLRLWHIGADATEIIRNAADAVGPVPQQSFSQYAGQIAGGFRTQNRSALKLQVTIQNLGGQHIFWMDANQGLEVYSDCIAIDLVLPPGFVEVPPDDVTRGPGLVADLQVGAFQFEIEESRSLKEVSLTTYHTVGANSQPEIQVPPFAQRATVYQTGAGSASTAWTMWLGAPSVGVELGTIAFIPGGRVSYEVAMPSATFLQPDLDTVDRFFTIRWTIRP